ncbi:efflux RND transporter permease subunit [Alicyclobacillaceae bacterium I2511]|nr:efflux RND transporter permease subunit [Alicyclobacillaceae bacterium I2511]
MNITQFSVRRPVTILMLVAGLVIAGLISYTLLPVRELPNVTYPVLQVTVNDPGANPADMRTAITDPMENALTTVNGIQSMTSISMQGVSTVTLQFAAGVDIQMASNDVAQALHRVANRLPSTASLPSVVESNPAAMPIMDLSLSGKLSSTQLYTLAQTSVLPAIESVPGVAAVDLQGGLIPQVNVEVQPSALEAYHVSIAQVRQALALQNASTPGGSIQQGAQAFTTTTNTPYTSVMALTNLVIPSGRVSSAGAAGGLTLGQVATITQGYAQPTTVSEMNGKAALGITISTQSGANSLSVASGVQKVLANLQHTLPPGAVLRITGDTTVYTRAALSAVLHDLLLAILITAGVLYVFLRRFSHTLIVLLAIPTSLIATFAVMYALGFSLDLISMLALSLLIGILVDDSIVVLENIHRHLGQGLSPQAAAVQGRMEIGAAAVAITLTDVVVYAPVAFVHGTVGQLFREFGLTVVAATLFSLFISFTLTPMLASKWLRPASGIVSNAGIVASLNRRLDGMGHAFQYLYRTLLQQAIRHRLRTVLIGVLALVLSVGFLLLGWVKTEFVPQQNANVFRVEVQMPAGTSLTTTNQAMQQLVQRISHIPSVTGVFSTAGQTLTGLTASNEGVLTIVRGTRQTGSTTLGGSPGAGAGTPSTTGASPPGKPHGGKRRGGQGGRGKATGSATRLFQKSPLGSLPPLNPVLAHINQAASKIPGMQVQLDVPNPLVVSGSQPITVQVSGPNLTVLNALAQQVTTKLDKLPGLQNVQNTAATNLPEWVIQVNPLAASQYGLSAAEIGQAVQTAISGSVASTLQAPGSNVQTNILVQLQNGGQLNAEQMAAIPIANFGGQMVTLGQVAAVSLAPGPVSLNEFNRQLSVLVNAGLYGVPLGTAAQAVRSALSSQTLPPGYTLNLGGEVAQQQAAFGPLTQALVLSVVLVYMLMAALYESLVIPLVVLFSLPMATVGALLGLMVTHQTLNVFSLIAMIMLMGLVAKNAILLVDRTRQLMVQGVHREDALLEAAQTRLRPIVMTTATLVCSMLPLALSRTVGASDRVPVAVVLIGGMTTSTLLTLVVVPALYTYFDDFRRWLVRLRRFGHKATTESMAD